MHKVRLKTKVLFDRVTKPAHQWNTVDIKNLDFIKAKRFDKVFLIPLQKKERVNANTTGWIWSELKSHFLRMLINDEIMSLSVGFAFCPTLFNNLINDLNEDRKYMCIMFAPDKNLRRIGNMMDDNMPVSWVKKILTGWKDRPNLTRWNLIRINIRPL